MDQMDATNETSSETVQQPYQPIKEYLSLKELCELIPFAESIMRNPL